MSEIRTQLTTRWQELVTSFFERPWEERSRMEKLIDGTLALSYLTTREVLRDRGPMLAASLAFFTVLAVVPLMTVAASLLAAFGAMGQADGLFETMQQLFPEVAIGVATYLEDMATTSAGTIGGIGAATLLIIGLVLFNAIEETLTRIWQGRHDRSMITKMLTFHAVITFGPLLIALSIVQTGVAHLFLSEMGLDVGWFERGLPILYALVAFTLLFKLVPNADVSWRAALVGALFTAIAFEFAKWGFNVYVNQLLIQTYDRVYGALALIPIGLIWMYVVWLVILVGAELSYSFQFIKELMHAEGGRRSSKAYGHQPTTLHPVLAMEVLAPVIQAYTKGEGGVSEAEIVKATELPPRLVHEVLRSLEALRLVVAVDGGNDKERAFVPGRPPESIALSDLVEHFWVSGHPGQSAAVQLLSEQYLQASRAFFGEQSGTALLSPASPAAESGP